MPDLQQRLAEIRQRCDKADIEYEREGLWGPHTTILMQDELPYLLDLVERLMEFGPVPEVVDGDMHLMPTLAGGNGCWFFNTPSQAHHAKLLTACEVHSIEPPEWLRQRASDAGTGGT